MKFRKRLLRNKNFRYLSGLMGKSLSNVANWAIVLGGWIKSWNFVAKEDYGYHSSMSEVREYMAYEERLCRSADTVSEVSIAIQDPSFR